MRSRAETSPSPKVLSQAEADVCPEAVLPLTAPSAKRLQARQVQEELSLSKAASGQGQAPQILGRRFSTSTVTGRAIFRCGGQPMAFGTSFSRAVRVSVLRVGD